MMDIYEIRYRNMQLLIARLEEKTGKTGERSGVLLALAEKLGKSPAQVSHFAGKNPSKNIGDQIAREIERAMDLEPGWLDWAQWDVAAGEGPAHLKTATGSQSQSLGFDVDIVSNTVRALLDRNKNEDLHSMLINHPEQFVQACQLYLQRTSDDISERQLGIKLADLVPLRTRDTGAGDEREETVPASGTPRRSVGKGRRR